MSFFTLCRSAALSLAAISAISTPALADDKIHFGLPITTDFLSGYIAIDEDIFAENGLDVTTTDNSGAAASAVLAGLMAGSFDILGTAAPSVIQAVDAGLPLVIIANGSVLPSFGNLGIVAAQDSGIKTVQDLSGKRIAVGGLSSILHFAAINWLRENGVDDTSVAWIEVLSPQMMDLMKNGQFDAAVMTEPFFTKAVDSGLATEVGQVYEKAPEGTSLAVYASTRQWAESHPEEIAKFRAALDKGRQLSLEDREIALSSLEEHTHFAREVLQIMGMPNLRTEMSTQNLEWWFETLKQQDVLTSDLEPASLIYK